MAGVVTAVASTLVALVAVVVAIRSDRRVPRGDNVRTYLALRVSFLSPYRELGRLEDVGTDDVGLDLARGPIGTRVGSSGTCRSASRRTSSVTLVARASRISVSAWCAGGRGAADRRRRACPPRSSCWPATRTRASARHAKDFWRSCDRWTTARAALRGDARAPIRSRTRHTTSRAGSPARRA